VQDTTRWNQNLSVRSDGKNIIGHAGALLLRACADRTGLTTALARVLPSSTANGWRDRAIALITLAGAIACGATNLLEAERLATHQAPILGAPASDSTLWRTLAALDEAAHTQIAKARAKIRRHVWTRLHLGPKGSPGSPSPENTSKGGSSSTWTPPSSRAPPTRKAPPAPSNAPTGTTPWRHGVPTPPSPWPPCCARATPDPTP